MKQIFRWDGQYWGFISSGNLFNASGEYRGWVEDDDSVWDKNGKYLGEIIDQNYILRKLYKLEPISRVPRVHPVCPMSPVRPINKVGKLPKVNYKDVLADID